MSFNKKVLSNVTYIIIGQAVL